jgi:hypothetical protein
MQEGGQANGDTYHGRKVRVDDLSANVTWSYSRRPDPKGAGTLGLAHEPGHSGRRFVLVAGLVVLAIWGVLYLLFRDWRARYQKRALYGATYVVPAIDPMARVEPPGVSPKDWRDAIASTKSMLLTVTSSNLLDDQQMVELRSELEATAARASADPTRAVTELAVIWNNVADRGEFLLKDSKSPGGDRHPRPRILPPRPAKPRQGHTLLEGSSPHRSQSA